jgi:hypothetical protein
LLGKGDGGPQLRNPIEPADGNTLRRPAQTPLELEIPHGQAHAIRCAIVEDYTGKYKGEQVEVALFGGEYQEGVLTAYCYVDEVAHIELNGHILVPLQNIASLHCSSRCDAPQNDDWPPRGLLDDDGRGEPEDQ